MPDHVGREDAQRFVEQLLSRLVAIEDDDGLPVHAAILLARLRTTPNGTERPCLDAEDGREGSKGRSATSTRAAIGSRTAALERIESLVIPPAWSDVWISPKSSAKLQATGIDAAGRRQYLYHPDFRAERERGQVRQARPLRRTPARAARRPWPSTWPWTSLRPERVSAVALRLINMGWFRVGSERYARTRVPMGSRRCAKRHAEVRGSRVVLSFRGKGSGTVRSVLVDAELATAMRELLALEGGSRLFRYGGTAICCNADRRAAQRLHRQHMGEEFTRQGLPNLGRNAARGYRPGRARRPGDGGGRRSAASSRSSGGSREQLANTPAVARASYISPAVIEQYLEGRTIEDFRPRHLRVVGARDVGLNPEEQSLLSLLRSWRIRQRTGCRLIPLDIVAKLRVLASKREGSIGQKDRAHL